MLIFSGVYWLPGVSITLVASIKYLILFTILFLYSKKITFNVSREFLKTDFFILLSLIVFLLFGDFSFGKIQYVVSTFFGLIFYTKVSKLKLSYFKDIIMYVPYISIILLLLFLGTYFSNYTNPYNGYLFEKTGFNAKSTGWSIFLFEIFALNLLSVVISKIKLLNLIVLSTLFFMMIISEGRSGLLASFMLVLWVLKSHTKDLINSNFIKYLLAITPIIIIFFFSVEIFEYLSRGSDFDDLNDLSTNRYIQYFVLSKLDWSNYILTGGGFQSTIPLMYSFQYLDLEFHNHFVRIILDHGIFFGLMIIIPLLKRMYRSTNSNPINNFRKGFLLCLIIILFSEPNVIIGIFFNSLIIWFFIGLDKIYENSNLSISNSSL